MVFAITPDRGDRPQFLDFCKRQIQRMTVPVKHLVIDHRPRSPEKDLIERVRIGYLLAKEQGAEFFFIVESDDFYPADYFERFPTGYDFVGDQRTIYYHIKSNGYEEQVHKGRASLFTTGFRISALDRFNWDQFKPGDIFLDIKLWDYARRRNLKTKFVDSGAIGIKHGLGVTGGIGHRQKYKLFDPDWKYLESKVDKEALEFYKSLR